MDERLRFREAMISRMDLSGTTAAEISRRTGVPKGTIDKLRQRKVDVTNVADAMKIAQFFGQSVEEFAGLTQRSGNIEEIVRLSACLPAEFQSALIAHLQSMIALRKSSSKG